MTTDLMEVLGCPAQIKSTVVRHRNSQTTKTRKIRILAMRVASIRSENKRQSTQVNPQSHESTQSENGPQPGRLISGEDISAPQCMYFSKTPHGAGYTDLSLQERPPLLRPPIFLILHLPEHQNANPSRLRLPPKNTKPSLFLQNFAIRGIIGKIGD